MFEEKSVQEIIDAGGEIAANIMNAHTEAMKNFCDWLKQNMDTSKTSDQLLNEFLNQ